MQTLNNLTPAFQALAEVWAGMICTNFKESVQYILDSCPIILAKQARSGNAKVALEYCDKSYNSSRRVYFAVKNSLIRAPGKFPVVGTLMLSQASVFDLNNAKQIMHNSSMTHSGYLLAEKAYIDSDWAKTLEQEHGLKLITPRKKAKGDKILSGDAFSMSVSSLRQPIESLLNWLNNRFHIQTASFIPPRACSFTSFPLSLITAVLVFKLFNS